MENDLDDAVRRAKDDEAAGEVAAWLVVLIVLPFLCWALLW